MRIIRNISHIGAVLTGLCEAEELYHRAMTSPEFSNEEFEQQMQSENLYKLCGFDVPKRGRPKAVKNDK